MKREPEKKGAKTLRDLKGRQREVVMLNLRGYSLKECANIIGIGYTHAVNSRRAACDALGVRSDTQIVALAVLDAREDVRRELAALVGPAEADRILHPISFIEELVTANHPVTTAEKA